MVLVEFLSFPSVGHHRKKTVKYEQKVIFSSNTDSKVEFPACKVDFATCEVCPAGNDHFQKNAGTPHSWCHLVKLVLMIMTLCQLLTFLLFLSRHLQSECFNRERKIGQ